MQSGSTKSKFEKQPGRDLAVFFRLRKIIKIWWETKAVYRPKMSKVKTQLEDLAQKENI